MIKFKTGATSELVSGALKITIKPKIIVFKSLGGYAKGDIKLAEKIVKDLADYLIKNNLIVTAGLEGKEYTLDFVAAEDLPEFVKNLTDDIS